jgi:hypothetical protein
LETGRALIYNQDTGLYPVKIPLAAGGVEKTVSDELVAKTQEQLAV